MEMNRSLTEILQTIASEQLRGREPSLPRLTPSERRELLALAHRNQLTILIARHLLPRVKGSEEQKLKRLLLINTLRNGFMRNEIIKLARAFNRKDLKVVFFAGLVSAPNEDLQSPRDIDLLVHSAQKKRAQRVIESQGYHPRDPNADKSWEADFIKEHPFSVEVDLHWQLTYPTHGRINPLSQETIKKLTATFLRNARQRQFNSVKLNQPAEEDLLLYQIIHFLFNHKARELKRLFDIAQLSQRGQIDWQRFTDIVQDANLGSFAYFALELASDILGSPSPKEILRPLKPTHLFYPLAKKIVTISKLCDPYRERDVPAEIVRQAGYEQTLLTFLLYDKPLLWKLRFLASPLVTPSLLFQVKDFLRLHRRQDIRTNRTFPDPRVKGKPSRGR